MKYVTIDTNGTGLFINHWQKMTLTSTVTD